MYVSNFGSKRAKTTARVTAYAVTLSVTQLKTGPDEAKNSVFQSGCYAFHGRARPIQPLSRQYLKSVYSGFALPRSVCSILTA